MKNNLIRGVLLGALLIFSAGCRRSDVFADQQNAFSSENLVRQASDLKQTIVVATPDAPIEPGKNVLWCGTFQLAWNQACDLIGEDIHLTNEPAMVAKLNKKTFNSGDLDPASYVAVARFVKDNIHDRIRSALAEKFGNAAEPVLVPDKSLTPNPNDIVAYAYLFKNLEFAVPFEPLQKPLNFGGREVAAFGMTGEKSAQEEMASQVMILDYGRRGDDFVIEIKTKSVRDHLILAKIRPGKTLNETIQIVNDRIRSEYREGFGPDDELAVPKFNFDITRKYSEIEGAELVVRNLKVGPGTYVASAEQNIRFQMDEKGVRLKSEARFATTAGIPHHLIFDKPFLVMLKRVNAKAPYFAMWLDNPELLVQR